MEGPAIELVPNAAIRLSMVLHELATNAMKHGALKSGSGHVFVCWSVEQNGCPMFQMEWKEQNPETSDRRDHKGFGSELLAALIEQDLGGKLEITDKIGGISVKARIPLARITPVSEPA